MKHSILGSAAGHGASHLRFWVTAGPALVADLLSKWAAWRWLEEAPEQSCKLIGSFLRFKLVYNRGIAFGLDLGWWPIVLTVLAGIGLVIYLFLASEKTAVWAHIGLGLILAGALGNMVDRLREPYKVRDFIDFSFWPTFNLADAFLCVGVGMLAIYMVCSPRPKDTSKTAG